MLIEDKLIEQYWELRRAQQLALVSDSSLFVLFKSDFSIPDSESLRGIPRVVGYWPKELQVKLYNPNTKRVASAVILSKKEAIKILDSKSFNYYWSEYNIVFSCFIVNESELKHFDSQVIIDRIEKQKQEKDNQNKIKENEMIKIINTNKLVVDELCDFALILVDYLMQKVIFHNKLLGNGFKKLFVNVQISFVQNIMWIFFNQILDLKPESCKFINKNIFKYIYNHQLVEYAMKYLDQDINLKQDYEQEFFNQTLDYYFKHFIRIITNKTINEKLLSCYKTNRTLLSKTHQKWKSEGWDEEFLEVDDSLPPNMKNIVYSGNYLDRVLYGQVKLTAYQMNQIILENFRTLYH